MVDLNTENKFKRNVAYKHRIGDLSQGKPEYENERFAFLDLNGKKIVRVNLVGNVIDKYDSEREEGKKYSTITIDDGSGQIKLKAFGDDTAKLIPLSQGQTILVIGMVRHWNDEIYIIITNI